MDQKTKALQHDWQFIGRVIELEQGFQSIEEAINTLKRMLEESPESPFTAGENMVLYTTVYNMCTQKEPYNYSEQLYDYCKQFLVSYINEAVLPALKQKPDAQSMLRELSKRWSNHKVIVRWFCCIFEYLDRKQSVCVKNPPSLSEVARTCFHDTVYQDIRGKAKDAVLGLIDLEREGGEIDRSMLKNVLSMFLEIGNDDMDHYENDFEQYFFRNTSTYYLRKASSWIVVDSCPEYMLKVEECLEKEKDRLVHYLHVSSEEELIERVRHELLLVFQYPLLEKGGSGLRALLKDYKVDDLSRMYKLYSEVPQGLQPIARIFKKHMVAEGASLFQREALKATGFSGKNGFVREVLELHGRFSFYVADCFQGHCVFQMALEGSFKVILDKGAAGSTTAKLLAACCDDILKNGTEGLSDIAIRKSLSKVSKLPGLVRVLYSD